VIDIRVPCDARVLVLDDNADRLQWFRDRLPTVDCVEASDHAIAAISIADPPYDVIFLDHDLGKIDTGMEVASHLASSGYMGDSVVIHSWNPDGARNMKNELENAVVVPYGQFEIKVV